MAGTPETKVVIIGLDSLEPSLAFERWADKLPNLTRLRERGAWGKLRSSDPPITVPAWMSMMSSKDPGTLGYYGFRKNTWDIPIVKVDRLGNNDLVLYISVPLSVSHANYISEFPQHLVSDKLTENAMLCAFFRSEPAAWMYSIISELTNGKFY